SSYSVAEVFINRCAAPRVGMAYPLCYWCCINFRNDLFATAFTGDEGLSGIQSKKNIVFPRGVEATYMAPQSNVNGGWLDLGRDIGILYSYRLHAKILGQYGRDFYGR